MYYLIIDVFKSIAANWRLHAEAKSLDLIVIPCSARVVSDAGMLRAMPGNLVGNAIRYTHRGQVLVGCRRHGNVVTIEVPDSGSGIPADQLGAFFEAFYQVTPPAKVWN
jgi:two-component system CheB/CheR fusion protein